MRTFRYPNKIPIYLLLWCLKKEKNIISSRGLPRNVLLALSCLRSLGKFVFLNLVIHILQWLANSKPVPCRLRGKPKSWLDQAPRDGRGIDWEALAPAYPGIAALGYLIDIIPMTWEFLHIKRCSLSPRSSTIFDVNSASSSDPCESWPCSCGDMFPLIAHFKFPL